MLKPKHLPAVSPALWGEPLVRGKVLSPREEGLGHVMMFLFWAPEGVVGVAICSKCGGRSEILLPFSGGPAQDAASGSKGTQAAFEYQANWALEHKGCTITPQQYVLSETVKDVCDAVVQAHADAMAEGEIASNALHVVARTPEGKDRILVVPFDDLPPEGMARQVAANALIYRLRVQIESERLDVLAAIHAAQSWVRTAMDESAERYEALNVVIVTPDFGRVGISRITRESGVPDEGPGRLDGFRWEPFVGRSMLVDGIFALPVPAKYDA